jgi:putative flippase GtrA
MGLKVLAGQVVRFAGIGLAAAALDYVILSGFIGLGFDAYVARLASIIPVVTATWLANRHLTFRSQSPPSWDEFVRYFGISAAGIAINYVLYWLGLFIGLPVWAAFVVGTATAAVFNFIRYRILLK